MMTNFVTDPGHEAGCESIIHAMHSIFEEESSEAVLLVDASNAFNSVNREAFLHNVSIILGRGQWTIFVSFRSPFFVTAVTLHKPVQFCLLKPNFNVPKSVYPQFLHTRGFSSKILLKDRSVLPPPFILSRTK